MVTENRKDYRATFYEARRVARKYGYCKTIAVEISGKLLYMTEGEVRALQILAKEAALESKEAFEDFCKNVIVYSNYNKRKSKYTMTFTKSGNFLEEFENGFFTANDKMAAEIL